MNRTRTGRSKSAIMTILALFVAGTALAARQSADPCKFEKTIRHGGEEISIDVPAGEPCGLGTFFMTVVPRKGNPQTLKANRDGMLTDAFAVELSGGAPAEIVVVAKGDGVAAFGAITIFESVDGQFVEKHVARLDGELASGYAGRDAFSIKDGVIIRQFPVYSAPSEEGAEPQPTGETRVLKYDFAGNRWIAP